MSEQTCGDCQPRWSETPGGPYVTLCARHAAVEELIKALKESKDRYEYTSFTETSESRSHRRSLERQHDAWLAQVNQALARIEATNATTTHTTTQQ